VDDEYIRLGPGWVDVDGDDLQLSPTFVDPDPLPGADAGVRRYPGSFDRLHDMSRRRLADSVSSRGLCPSDNLAVHIV
jgi:hypothetical protein